MGVYTKNRVLWNPVQGLEFLQMVKLPDVGAGNWVWVICKNSPHRNHWAISSSQPPSSFLTTLAFESMWLTGVNVGIPALPRSQGQPLMLSLIKCGISLSLALALCQVTFLPHPACWGLGFPTGCQEGPAMCPSMQARTCLQRWPCALSTNSARYWPGVLRAARFSEEY